MINLSKMHKRIKRGLLIVLVLSLIAFVPQNTKAVTHCTDNSLGEGEEKQYASDILINRYGLKVESLGDNKYKISMNPPENKDERCKKSLKVVKINDKSVDVTLKCDSPYEFKSSLDQKTESGIPGISLKVEGKNIISKEEDSNSCYFKKAVAIFEVSGAMSEKVTEGPCPDVELELANYSSSEINCSTATSEFDKAFCSVKRKAKNTAGHNKSGDINSSDFTASGANIGQFTGSLETGSVYCDANLKDTNTNPLKPYENTGAEYFTGDNTQYYYAKATKKYPMGYYEYNYGVNYCVYGDKITCKVTCEEALTVQYGPPVASFAGMCFEYKVRVTSRVACKVSTPPAPPDRKCYHIEPYPTCVTSTGAVFRQGGPNEQFDACVQECDGGKYSKSCSRQCYKEVYGATLSAGAAVNNKLLEEVQGTRLANKKGTACSGIDLSECKEITGQRGCYGKTSGGTLAWMPAYTKGWWYSNVGPWSPCNPPDTYDPDSYGIMRHQLGDGEHCQDSCHWVAASGKYLNKGLSEWDYLNNVDKYNKAVKACKAMASCSTETAEFKIRAEYNKKGDAAGDAPIQVIFPYESQKDSISRNGTDVTTTYNSEQEWKSTLRPNFPDSGSGLQGCYKNGDTRATFYRVTWGFPGSWKNMKTNEIAYKPGGNDTAWKAFPDNFCIPNDAKDVNAKWFFAYYNRMIKNHIINVEDLAISESSQYLTQNYESVSTYAGTKDANGKYSKITYNIIADAIKGFGYFNWKVNINCFFALGTETPCGDHCPGGGLNYVIRSVDQKDLFPSKNGDPHSADVSGRTPEFNWSNHATQTKNSGYKSEPNTYMKALQKYAQTHVNDLYNDSNLDYEFYLSPETLRTIRNDNWSGSSKTNYTAFKDADFYLDMNGVGRYYSKFIREIGDEGDRKVPKHVRSDPAAEDALRCNNMQNYLSKKCCVSFDLNTGNCIAG